MAININWLDAPCCSCPIKIYYLSGLGARSTVPHSDGKFSGSRDNCAPTLTHNIIFYDVCRFYVYIAQTIYDIEAYITHDTDIIMDDVDPTFGRSWLYSMEQMCCSYQTHRIPEVSIDNDRPRTRARERERCRGRIAATIICRRKRRRGWRRLRGRTSRGSPPSATPNPPGASTPLSTRTPSSRPILTPSPSSISSGISRPVARFLVTPISLIALSFDSDAVFSFICYLDSVSSVQ